MDVGDILRAATRLGASDIHLGSNEPPVIRVQGVLRRVDASPFGSSRLRDWLRELFPEGVLERDSFDSVVELPTYGRFRLNVFRHQHGLAAALRIIPERVPRFDTLGLPSSVRQVARCEQGLVLITGATGSGKSTTMAAIIDEINSQRSAHILTIEDPIEFLHESRQALIRQRQVGRDAESFPGALRAMLREDPDIIVVGELRDRETMQLALTAAETGHLVLATAHSSDAPRTIHRIVDAFSPEQHNQVRAMLAESLQMIVSQTLRAQEVGGRVLEAEVLIATPAVRTLIRDAKLHQLRGVMQASGGAGMRTVGS